MKTIEYNKIDVHGSLIRTFFLKTQSPLYLLHDQWKIKRATDILTDGKL